MSRPQTRERAGRTARQTRNDFTFGTEPTKSYVPRNWRERLCAPLNFYRKHVPELGATDADGMAKGRCPLCADRSGTLTIRVTHPRGHWHCDASCSEGDMIAFAQRLLGLTFSEAVRELMGART